MAKTQRENLLDLIHCGIEPFEGFDASGYAWKPDPWNNEKQTFWFDHGIPLVRPSLYLEMGTWFGRSARYVTDLQIDAGVADPCVLCVDTWLGSVEHWMGRARKRLDTANGYPQFYYQFLANCVNAGSQYSDVILPFPTSSTNAARYLANQGITSPFIFIDASHEEEDVYLDLVLCEKLLPSDGGIMVCDDVAHYFPGVEKAIKQFMQERPGRWRWLKSGSVTTALVPTKRQDWINHLEEQLVDLRAREKIKKAERAAKKRT